MTDDHRPNVVVLPQPSARVDEERIASLAALSALEYDRVRKVEAKKMGVRVSALDQAIDDTRRRSADADTKSSGGGAIASPEPWPEEVFGRDLAERVQDALTRHVVFADIHHADALTLWLMGTYLMDTWMLWPKVLITSPVKRCGKSTLLEVMEAIACRAYLVSNITAASFFRAIDAWLPTLLIDEADRFMRFDQALNGIINAGHRRRTANVLRMVEGNGELRPVNFSVWSAQAIAGIGAQADTLADRSIRIALRRRMADDRVERLRSDYFERQSDIRRKLVRWAGDVAARIRENAVEPPEIGNDRALDNWTPLLRIALTLGGNWPERTLKAYRAMEAAQDEQANDEPGVMLLRHVLDVMVDHGVTEIAAGELAAALARREESPWADWRGGNPITTRGVATLLRPFDIRSHRQAHARVYAARDFEDALRRYLPEEPLPSVTSVIDGASLREISFENRALTLGDGYDACDGADGSEGQGLPGEDRT